MHSYVLIQFMSEAQAVAHFLVVAHFLLNPKYFTMQLCFFALTALYRHNHLTDAKFWFLLKQGENDYKLLRTKEKNILDFASLGGDDGAYGTGTAEIFLHEALTMGLALFHI